MTDDQSSTADVQPDYLKALLDGQKEIRRNWTMLGASLGGFIFGVAEEQAGLAACSAIILMVFAVRIVKNFFYLFAPRLPKYRDMVTEARIAEAVQIANSNAGRTNNRTITQDDAMNYAVGGIAVTMPYDDYFDGPF